MAEHIAPKKTYILVWAALMVLTLVTIGVAQLNLGPFNDVVALAVAVTKALLVILFFMHVKDSSRLTRLTVVAGFFWLAILIGITLTDYLSRPTVDKLRAVPPAGQLHLLGESRQAQPGNPNPTGRR
ncbi:MAG TPA: cytochrome C oxidase subunit IV family protein [Thermoanaerobaculia bacterium]|nr:cytochrome C oxidase subunit IV family protein [Thermoanaerobaculia bacterium]